MQRVSVVVPVFNSEGTLEGLVERLRVSLAERYDLEIVLVNDGSVDGSGEVCRGLAARHPWVRFVDLSRNFGEHNAVMAGLRYASGTRAARERGASPAAQVAATKPRPT